MSKKESKSRIKEFFCELFDSHDWEYISSYDEDDTRWDRYKCRKCGKKDVRPAPVLITTPFMVGHYGQGSKVMVLARVCVQDGA